MNPTLIEEMMAAGRGVFGLLTGDRKSPDYFDFSLRGLVGSFIAFAVITAVNAGLPLILGIGVQPGGITRGIIMVVILYALQLAFAAIVLRQVKRLDGLLPYVVADNWATFFITLISAALAAAGVVGDFVIVIFGIIVIITEINIARLVVTLPPLQIAMFIIAQVVGVSIGLALIGMLFPVPPDVAAQLTAG